MTNQEKALVQKALAILSRELKAGSLITAPADAFDFARLLLAAEEREIFAVILLNTQHQVIHTEKLFFGTIDSSSVYPREVVKLALAHNAAAVIFAHNHPSGVAEPSEADKRITRRLVDALELIDVRVLDHIVVSLTGHTSFAERGLL
jgi:DNA repair protein RadC